MKVPSAIRRTTLLLVDPNEESRRDTHLHLAAAGFHVLSHSLASNALESPGARLARLLLATAHRDNQSDVEQLLPRLRSRGWSGTGIVLGTETTDELAHWARRAGYSAIINPKRGWRSQSLQSYPSRHTPAPPRRRARNLLPGLLTSLDALAISSV